MVQKAVFPFRPVSLARDFPVEMRSIEVSAGMKKATATVPFPYVDSPGCNYEQLFLTEKLRREQVLPDDQEMERRWWLLVLPH